MRRLDLDHVCATPGSRAIASISPSAWIEAWRISADSRSVGVAPFSTNLVIAPIASFQLPHVGVELDERGQHREVGRRELERLFRTAWLAFGRARRRARRSRRGRRARVRATAPASVALLV